MYFFKVLKDSDIIKDKYDCVGPFSYTAYDGDREAGSCECEINKELLIIRSVDFENDEICEGLLRSCLNYGANRGAYIARSSFENASSVMKNLGFQKNGNGEYEGEIPSLLSSSCGGCNCGKI